MLVTAQGELGDYRMEGAVIARCTLSAMYL